MAHRDVSLENVFVTHDGIYKIGDFGLSTKANTKTSDFVAKAQYMAPEVAAQVTYIPVVADVWSLGILLFMLLTGDPLLEFASPTSQEFKTVRAVGCCGVLKSWGIKSQLSAATMDLLSKMLEFDPTKRLQSMAQVLNHSALLGIYSTRMSMMDRAMYYQSFGTQDSFSPRDDLSSPPQLATHAQYNLDVFFPFKLDKVRK
ncbi:hypothetical protein PsorP6_014683 [Peronosclerospora sorghi]|uniref:Uncharacterized protein n=1 Tax=Peronosclerospora sorghi TaxID=230839 RepID=A0ACC0VT87_9STRA|nr:hypothetical protein PsorP6_014683 [Peronosclerospora sorghi]